MDKCHAFIKDYIIELELDVLKHSEEGLTKLHMKRYYVFALIEQLFLAKHIHEMNGGPYASYNGIVRGIEDTHPEWFDGLEYMYEDIDEDENEDEDEYEDEIDNEDE